MSDIVLTQKGHRLVQLCERSGFKDAKELFLACLCEDLCPAISCGQKKSNGGRTCRS